MKLAIHWQIFLALILAFITGMLIDDKTAILGLNLFSALEFAGKIFLNALKMLVVPLIVSAIISGIASVGDKGGFERLGLKTLAYYLTTSLIAILIGLFMVNLFAPGEGGIKPEVSHQSSLEQVQENAHNSSLMDIFIRMIPVNVVAAAAEGQMLGLIFFCILFGFFMTKIPTEFRKTVTNFWQGIFEVMMLITGFVMKFSPIGVFALVASSIAEAGVGQFTSLLWFFITVLMALTMHFVIVMPLILRFAGKINNPLLHYRAMLPALFTAFSTSSSSATLPITINSLEERAGVSNRISSFVLPLGATVNMDGTALYECVAVIFIAQVFGVDLSLGQQFMIVVMALATSIGVAGIPSASLVAISIILASVGLPMEAIGMLLVVDRLLDMLRTAVNVFSDSVGAVVIARSEGERQVLRA